MKTPENLQLELIKANRGIKRLKAKIARLENELVEWREVYGGLGERKNLLNQLRADIQILKSEINKQP